MSFPLNVVVAVIITLIHITISFSLKLPALYKNKFRFYSVFSSLLFIAFLFGFSIYFNTSIDYENYGLYFEGLAALYLLLVVPLLATLIFLLFRWVLKLSDFSLVTRSIAVLSPSVLLIGMGVLGYAPFMLSFYGFAP